MKDNQINGWQLYFDKNADNYEKEVFTRNTQQEVAFIVELIGDSVEASILDIGCGTGRHALELARRGYRVTGIDISSAMLQEAKVKAEKESLTNVDFIEADARTFSLGREFDLALSLCEGSFGLLSATDNPFSADQQILHRINQHLKRGGKLLMTVLNALRIIRQSSDEDVRDGRFDNLSLTEIYELQKLDPEIGVKTLLREKYFTAAELNLMLQITGFRTLNFWGGTAGDWQKGPLKMDEMEIMLLAEKS